MELFHAIAGLAVATVIFVYGVGALVNLSLAFGVHFTSHTGGPGLSPGTGPDRAEFFKRMARRGIIAAGSFAVIAVPIALLISRA